MVIGILCHGIARGQDTPATGAASEAAPATTAAPEPAPAAEGEPPKITIEDALKKAAEAAQKGDLQGAYNIYNQMAVEGERDPGFTAQGEQLRLIGYTGRGQILGAMKEYEAAADDFKQATDINPNYVPALLARGQMYLDIGNAENYGAALSDFQNAVKAQRGNIVAQFGLGKVLILTNNYQAGIGPLTKVIAAFEANKENPDAFRAQHAEAYRLRGIGYSGVYKLKEARDDFSKSLALNPDDHETYLALGALAFRDESFQEAAEQLGKAIEKYKPKDPEDKLPYVQGHVNRANAYLEMGKKTADPGKRTQAYEAAKHEIEKVLQPLDDKNPYHAGIRAQALYWRGVAERMLGQLHQAVQSFSESIELNPEFSEAYYRRGICYHYLGDDRLAIADFTEASNISFDDPRAALWLGFTHAKMGNYLDALRAYSDAIAASDRFTPAYVNRGLAYMALGENNKALVDFNDAVRLEPTNPDYYFKRGLAYEALGENQKAAESFAAAVEFNDKHAAAYRHLSDAMRQLGRTELAAQYRQRATQLEAPKKSQ